MSLVCFRWLEAATERGQPHGTETRRPSRAVKTIPKPAKRGDYIHEENEGPRAIRNYCRSVGEGLQILQHGGSLSDER